MDSTTRSRRTVSALVLSDFHLNRSELVMSELVPLNLLRSGARGAIDLVSGMPNEIQRMEELGLSAGNEIEVLQEGCPCIVRCRGVKYCLRGNECSCIWVRISDLP